MTIAIDVDGVLTLLGDFFEKSIPIWQKTGIRVGILTARSEREASYITEAFDKVGLKLDFYIFKPDAIADIPNGIYKGILCQAMHIDLLFDDCERNNAQFITDITQSIKGTRVLTPLDFPDQTDAHDNTIKDYAEQMIQALSNLKGK